MLNFSTTICYFFAVLAFAAATNVTRCFNCNTTSSQHCMDPFNVEMNKPSECSSLIYDTRGRSSILNEIGQEERTGGNFSYACIKVTEERGNTSSLARTCWRAQQNIEETCDFILRESERDPTVTITSCNVCFNDECNTGTIHQVSAVLLGVLLFFASGF